MAKTETLEYVQPYKSFLYIQSQWHHQRLKNQRSALDHNAITQ